jgi:hypothetical protein
MYPIRQTGPSVTVGAGATVAVAAPSSHVLVSNSAATWSDFAFAATAAVPATPLLPIPPNGQLLVQSTGSAYYASSIGSITVTPCEVRQ